MCTLEKGLASHRAISMAGRALVSSQLEVDATDLPKCLHQPGPFRSAHLGRKLSFSGHSNMSGFQNGLSSIIMRLRTQFSALTCRKMFKEKKNKTSTKADPAFVKFIIILSSKQIIKSFVVYFLLKYGYEIHGIWFS